MLFSKLFCFASAVVMAAAAPNWKPTTTKATTTTPVKTTPAKTKSATPTATSINNGDQFIDQCVNVGISVADCTALLNIAALNGNSVVVGGSGGSSGNTGINNGQQFFTQCANFGISVLDCAEVLNLALLNGNTIDIDLSSLVAVLQELGLPTLLASLLPIVNGLVVLGAGTL